MFVVCWILTPLCFKQEDQSVEWMTKGQAMALKINVLHYNGLVFR